MTIYFPLLIASCGFITIAVSETPSSPTPAPRIIDLVDGETPLAPPPEKPKFIVPPSKILSTETHTQGGRQIKVQQITPIALPPPPPDAVAPQEISPEQRELLQQRREQFPRQEFINLSATVYGSKTSSPYSFVTLWQRNENTDGGDAFTPITFWSSEDFSLITSFSSFEGSDGKTRTVFISWSIIDFDRMSERAARARKIYKAPQPPPFPPGIASFKITSGDPKPSTLTAIQALHDLYNTEKPRLQAAYEKRQQAQFLAAAEAKANPPQPKDLTISYWRLPSRPTVTQKGGAK